MPSLYLLPCECGRALTVAPAQAGREIQCECGCKLHLPTLARLRQLEPAAETAEKKPLAQSQSWNAIRGILFVIGTLLAIVGLSVGSYASWVARSVDVAYWSSAFHQEEAKDLKMIEEMPVDAMYEHWNEIKKAELGVAGTAAPVQAAQFQRSWVITTVVGVSVAAVGILMAAGSLLKVQNSQES